MWRVYVILALAAVSLLCLYPQFHAFRGMSSFRKNDIIIRRSDHGTRQSRKSYNTNHRLGLRVDKGVKDSSPVPSPPEHSTIPPSKEDMKEFAFILANITDHLQSSPETALSIASQNMGWLFARDAPKLAQMLLDAYPVLREDQNMMQGYMFLLDFLEVVAKESNKRVQANQALMKQLLEATKTSESAFDAFIEQNKENLTSADFQLYLDTEIETRDSNSGFEQMLVTIKLRLLEEQGKSLGVDVQLLPKLAVEQNPAELKRKTTMHLDSYDSVGQALFLQTLRIMRSEMKKRYQNVDPTLDANLQEIEKITESYLKNKEN